MGCSDSIGCTLGCCRTKLMYSMYASSGRVDGAPLSYRRLVKRSPATLVKLDVLLERCR